MPYLLDQIVRLVADLTNVSSAPTDPATLIWLVTDPSGAQTDETSSIVHDGTGVYHLDYTPTKTGLYRWRLVTTGLVTVAEGTFEVQSIYLGGVTDVRDLRVLIPACRRAIDGPAASSPTAPSTTLDDQQVLALVADATAELILNTASQDGADMNAFGNQLVVVARDPFYLAPVAWATHLPRSTAQDAAILSQAALDHYFWLIKMLKVSETLKNEAVTWEYTLSANVIAAWIAYLIDNRDKAIAALQTINVVLDSYVSLVAERDRLSAAWLEPWVTEVGAPVPYVGGGGSGPLDVDFRFGTYG